MALVLAGCADPAGDDSADTEVGGSSGTGPAASETEGKPGSGEQDGTASTGPRDEESTGSDGGGSDGPEGTDDGSDDSTGEPMDDTIGVFVATGSVSRRIVSLDDGLSWTHDQTDDPDVTCAANNMGPNPNCFEGTYTARGVAFDSGRFLVTYDWSTEPNRTNSVRVSDDAITWDIVFEPGGFGGIAAGDGVVVLAGPSGTDYVMRSEDGGTSWTQHDNGYADIGGWSNIRRTDFVPGSGGVFILGGDGNGFDSTVHVVTSPDGMVWSAPDDIPDQCPSGFRLRGGFGSVGDRLVIVGPDGRTCHSDDAGATWMLSDTVPGMITSHDAVLVDDGIELWTADTRVRTEDGVTWQTEPLSGDSVNVGPVARDPDTGTYVGVTSGYLNGYAGQQFFRSEDGLTWEILAADVAPTGHPILAIEHGRIAIR